MLPLLDSAETKIS
jgi:hypothetical protein